MNFSGKIKINDCAYDCHMKDYEMVVTKSDSDFLMEQDDIGWKSLLNKWITIFSDDEFDKRHGHRDKYIVLLTYKSASKGVLRLNIIACLKLLEHINSIQSDDIVKILAIRSKVLDLFYWSGKSPNDRKEIIASAFREDHRNKYKSEKHEFCFGKKRVILSLDMIVAHKRWFPIDAEGFPFDIFVAINVECEKGLNVEETLNLCHHVKSFLSFVSNTRDVVLEEVLVNLNEYMPSVPKSLVNYPFGEMLIAQGVNRNDEITKLIPYDLIKGNISNMFDEIINNKIFFVSLYEYEKNTVSSVDILNICAAFENQFYETFPDFRDDEFDKTKYAVMEKVKELKASPDLDMELITEFVNWNSYYKGTLKNKLDYALNVFIDMFKESDEYWEFEIERINHQKYQDMPKRIKNARNNLSHGELPKDLKALHDTFLLRAVIYALILKKTKLDDAIIVKCVKKLFIS